MRLRGVLLFVGVALMVGAEPSGARAATVGFDDLPVGTSVDSQYEVATGARFVTSVPWFNPDDPSTGSADDWTGVLPVVRNDALADTAPNVGDMSGCSGEFCAARAQAFVKFSTPQQMVSLHVGDFGTASELASVKLSGYDRRGILLDTSSPGVVVGGGGYGKTLSVTSPAGEISYVRIRAIPATAKRVAFDTLTFAPLPGPPPPPTPAFDIQRTGPNPFALGLAPGESRTAPIVVLRYGTSTGPIVFDFPGLPGFLKAEVDPNPANVADGASVAVRITATKDAAPVIGAAVTVRARALDPVKTGAGDRTVTIPVTVRGAQSLAIGGVEVTQGVQQDLNNPPGSLTPFAPTDAGLPKPAKLGSAATYAGVKLVDGRKTVVRVFANSGLGGASISGAQVTLDGARADGKALPGSPLLPDFSPSTVGPGPLYTTMSQRASPTGAFTFTLPPQWASGTIALRASISVPGFLSGTPVNPLTGAFSLQGIHFTRTGSWQITALEGTIAGKSIGGPFQVFAGVRAAMPFAEGHLVLPSLTKAVLVCPPPSGSVLQPCFYKGDLASAAYEGQLSLQDIVNCDYTSSFFAKGCDDQKQSTADAMDRLTANIEDSYGLGDTSVLVVDGPTNSFGGLTSLDEDTGDQEEYRPSVVTPLRVAKDGSAFSRALSSVAHEVGHGLGLAHAGQNCVGSGPGDGADAGTPWPADNQGLIQGIGLDPRTGSGGSAGPYQIFAQGFDARGLPVPTKRWFDLMSYCAGGNDNSNWLSARYWNELVDLLATRAARDSQGRARPAAASSPMLSVRAFVSSSGNVEIDPLRRVTGRAAIPGGLGTSRFHLIALNAAGRTLSDTPMDDDVSHVDGLGALVRMKALLRPAGVAAVKVARDGVVLATRRRSAHAPVVRILAPRSGARTGGGRTTTIRFRATDADRDHMLVKVDYSTDDGRLWHNIYIGPNRGRVELASAYFSASRHARVRIVANDGFNETAAVSGRFTAAGSAPGVLITSPAKGRRQPNDAALYLSGEGSNDKFQPLRGRALRWYVGRRQVGSGNQVAVFGLSAGPTRIRLLACDRLRRCSAVTTIVRLTQALPRLLLLGHPKRLSPGARVVRLRVSSTVTATLTIGASRFAVSRQTQVILLHVRRSHSELSLQLVLSAGGRKNTGHLTIPRS